MPRSPHELNVWSAIFFSLEQNFALWAFFFTVIHFPWIHPAIAITALALALVAFLSGSRASQSLFLLYALVGWLLLRWNRHELVYFALGLAPLVLLAFHLLAHSRFALARAKLSQLRALILVMLLYPASFWALHEPGFPVPSMLSPSGIIYLPFLPIESLLFSREDWMTQALFYLNW